MVENTEPISDDSMITPESTEPDVTETTSSIQQIGGTMNNSSEIDASLSQLIDSNDGQMVHEPTCSICSSPHRKDIEDKYTESDKKTKPVQDFIKQKLQLDMSSDVIQNHMVYHLSRGVKALQMIEYANKIKRLTSYNLSTLDTINLGKAALQERLMGVNSITPGGDVGMAEVEKIKSQETSRIMTTLNNLLKLQAHILGEMKASGDILAIPREPFIKIFNDAILNAKTDEEREIVGDILNKMLNLSKVS